MKIICTKEEKQRLVYMLVDNSVCVFGIGKVCPKGTCEECIENTIEWKITDEEL